MKRTDDARQRLNRAVEHVRYGLGEMFEIAPQLGADVEHALGILIGHVRNWRPTSITPLSATLVPTEPVPDGPPRGDHA